MPTELLEQAFALASALPPGEQNDLARELISRLESDARWDALFATSGGFLDSLAREAIEAEESGDARPMNIADL